MDFWQFLAGYWWLAFPLVGVFGMFAGSWEKASRERHKRKLEMLKVKSELKAAQVASRPRLEGRRHTGPSPVEAAEPTALERLLAAHDEVTARWLQYELDVGKLIAYPAMSDGRQPLTAAFLRAKKSADGLRPASASSQLSPEQLREYREAVTDYEVAFDVAERDARRLRDSSFTDSERRRLDTAKQLLTVAIDEAATPAERQLAYRRVREELDGLISISDDAIDVLEKRVSLELPATPQPTSRADAAPAREEAVPLTPPKAKPAPGATWPVPGRGGSPS